MYTLELLALTWLISMDPDRFSAVLKRALCGYQVQAINHLQRTMSLVSGSASGSEFTLEMDVVNSTDAEEPSTNNRQQDVVNEHATDDQQFKEQYSKEVLARTTTLRLKASFHLINYIMMSVCHVMLTSLSGGSAEDSDQSLGLPTAETSI